jgi:sec-independent protein translocase protein TatA
MLPTGSTPFCLAFMGLGPSEMLLVAVIALLLFGSDLPNVARTWGKTFNEFRRHLTGIRDEFNDAIYTEPETPRRLQYHPEYHREGNGSPETAALPVAAALPPAEAGSPSATGDAVSENPATEPPAGQPSD